MTTYRPEGTHDGGDGSRNCEFTVEFKRANKNEWLALNDSFEHSLGYPLVVFVNH